MIAGTLPARFSGAGGLKALRRYVASLYRAAERGRAPNGIMDEICEASSAIRYELANKALPWLPPDAVAAITGQLYAEHGALLSLVAAMHPPA